MSPVQVHTHTAYHSVPPAGPPSAPAYQVSLRYKFTLTQHTILFHLLVHLQHQLIRYVSCTSSHSHSIPFCATPWSTFSTSLSGKSWVQVHTHTSYHSVPPSGQPSAPAYQVSLWYKFTLTQHMVCANYWSTISTSLSGKSWVQVHTHTAYHSVPPAGPPSAPAFQVSLRYKFTLIEHMVCATRWSTFSTSLSSKSRVQVHTHTAYGSVPPAGPPSAPAYQVSLRYKFILTQQTVLCHPLLHLQHQLIR